MSFWTWFSWALLFYSAIACGLVAGIVCGCSLIGHAYMPPDMIMVGVLGVVGSLMLLSPFSVVLKIGTKAWDPSV
jgi:hypothetical protein